MRLSVAQGLRRKLGQNTAEYLIILVVIAVGSLGVFTIFGSSIQKQLSNVIVAFTGTGSMQNLEDTSTQSNTRSNKKVDMNLNGRDLSYGK